MNVRELYGFAGKTLQVNLTTSKIASEPLDRLLAEQFIGGMGISSWLAYNLAGPETDPLSPDNPLIFGVSPLTGTLAPASSRVHVNSRSPDSGFISYSNAGHSMGIMMKYAGYDNLVITGRAEKPVYLKISDDEVEVHEASHLWGRDTWETTDLIRKELKDYWVDCIGPSAENMVRYSIILCSKRSSFNKTAPGTVMGSKNLKAIAARGTKGVKVAYPEKFKRLTDEITRSIVTDPEVKIYRAFGSPPPKSSPSGFTYEEFCKRIAERPYACLSCPIACKHMINLRDGPYKGLNYRISHFEALRGHNRLAGSENWDELAKVVESENRCGIEASVAAGMLSYLVDCYDHGILTEEEIGFAPKRGGSAFREIIPMIVKKEGIGALLSEGMIRASEKVGKDSEKYTRHHKGIGREHGLEREVSLTTIGSLTNPRGGKAEFAHIPFSNGDSVGQSPEMFRRFFDDLGLRREAADRVCQGPDSFNVGRLTKWCEDYITVSTSMGLCNRTALIRHFNLRTLSELYQAATGLYVSPAKLLTAGERVFNVLKAFNVKMGATRLDDMPSRGTTWPADKSLMMAGKEYGSLNQILNEYYDERGWEAKSGVPTRQKLIDLGLESIADDIGA